MKRNYYIFSAGKLMRKENTIFFLPAKEEKATNAQQTDQEIKPLPESEMQDESKEEILTETFSEEQKEEQKQTFDGNKKVIPIEDIESFYCFASINFNSRLLQFLTKYRIPLHIFNHHGYYDGSYYPREYLQSGFLVVNQVKHYLDSQKRLAIARELIHAASFNILKNLRYYNSRECDLESYIAYIETERNKIQDAQDIPHLMGIEGRIRDKYYETWNIILKPQGETFKLYERNRQPPLNAINALISFGNALVYTASLCEIYRTQLQPTISFLHEPGERRFSLSLDIAEIFKPLFTDRIIFKLLNQNIIQEKHFDQNMNYCYLKEEGRKIFVKEFEEKLTTTIKHRKLKRDVSYRRLIRMECYKLIKHLVEEIPYEGFQIWW